MGDLPVQISYYAANGFGGSASFYPRPMRIDDDHPLPGGATDRVEFVFWVVAVFSAPFSFFGSHYVFKVLASLFFNFRSAHVSVSRRRRVTVQEGRWLPRAADFV